MPPRPPARSAQRRSKQAFCLHSQPYYHHKLVQCLDNLRSKVPTAARARLPSSPCRTARQPKLTSIGKSDLSARPKRKYASLRNDGQINETGNVCMNIEYTLGTIFIICKGVLRLFRTTHPPMYVRTFSLHKVRKNCHFLDHPPLCTYVI